MKQFTDKYIASLKPRDTKYFVRETRGFTLQVLPSGSKSFLYIFQLKNIKGYLPLGTYPTTSLAAARTAYNEAYNLVKAGVDPRERKKAAAEEKEQEKLATKAAAAQEIAIADNTFHRLLESGIPEGFIPTTVGQLAAVYYLKYSATHHTLAVHRNLLYALRGDFLQEMGHKRITDVRRSDAIALIDKVAARAPGQSGNVLKAARQVFEYALQREWSEIQPFLSVAKAVPNGHLAMMRSVRLGQRSRRATQTQAPSVPC